jgi:putative ABC transport system substrate-binding protein
MLELLREIAPGLKRVAMLFNPDTAPGGGKYYFSEFEAAARSSNVEPIAARAHSDAEIENVVNSLGGEPGSGLIVMPDFFYGNPCQANPIACSTKQSTGDLSLEVRSCSR